MKTEHVIVAIKRLPGAEDLPLPSYQSEHAAAMDLYSAVKEPLALAPGAIAVVPCGFAIALPLGFEAQIRPRSGLATKSGITLPNAPATIDADYRGEIQVPLINLGSETLLVTRGMRIAQMLVLPIPRTVWQVVEELPPTARGGGGFGHTGT